MKNYRVVIFGDLPLATKLAEFFNNRSNLVLDLVVIGNRNPNNYDPFSDTLLLEEFARKEKIPTVYNFEIFRNSNSNYDIGVSARYSNLIPNYVRQKFKYGIINLHGGLLPKFAGSNSCVHALIENSKMAGGTLHWIDSSIDTGFIINKKEFRIESTDTAFMLFQRTQKVLLEMALEFFKNLAFVKGPQETQIYKYDKKEFRFYKKADLLKSRNLTKYLKNHDFECLHRNVRAFTFPGKEKAYVILDKKKIYLSTSPV